MRQIKLSSEWTTLGIYGSLLLCVFMFFILTFVAMNQAFHGGMIVAWLAMIVVTGLVVYQFLYACEATLNGDVIVLKKQFREAKSYSFDKIGFVRSFQLKSTRYTIVEMFNEDGSPEKFLVLNSRALLSFERKNAEEILISLRGKSAKQ